jgi:transposase InsO family protein
VPDCPGPRIGGWGSPGSEELMPEASGVVRKSHCDSAKLAHKPRLLSDNGSSYISSDLAEWLKDHGMAHVRGYR